MTTTAQTTALGGTRERAPRPGGRRRVSGTTVAGFPTWAFVLFFFIVPLAVVFGMGYWWKARKMPMDRVSPLALIPLALILPVIYALLKHDLEVLSKVSPGTKPPEPVLYNAETHHKHRSGQYRASLPKKPSNVIELPTH